MTRQKPKVRLLAVTPSLELGGAERVMLRLLARFSQKTFEINLIVIGGPSGQLASEIPSGVDVKYLRKRRVISALPRLLFEFHRHKPSVVFSSMSHLNLLLAIFNIFLPKFTCLIARESSLLSRTNDRYRCTLLWNWLYRRFYMNVDALICQSAIMRNELITLYNFPEQKCRTIPNPIDKYELMRLADEQGAPSLFEQSGGEGRQRFGTETRHLLTVGKFRSEKNFHNLIRAMARLKGRDVVLHMIGDGPEFDRVQCAIKEFDIEEHVITYGVHMNPYRAMREADALIISSIYEGMPNSALESLALGTPVISTPAQGVMHELLGDCAGCRVGKGADEDSLFNLIDEWMDSPITQPNRDIVTKNQIEFVVQKYEALFQGFSK